MPMNAEAFRPAAEDPVGNVLKWVLLAIAILTFGLMGWATVITYRTTPPQPDRFLGTNGRVVMTEADIGAGKAGFQKTDLMDFGSRYGMGSYYGEDYTATFLVRLATLTEQDITASRFGRALTDLSADQQSAVKRLVKAGLSAGHQSQVEPALQETRLHDVTDRRRKGR